MKTTIIIHVLPSEIDWFEKISDSLLRNSTYLSIEESKNVFIDATLNLSPILFNFNKFKIPKDYFLDRWKLIEQKLGQVYTSLFNIEDGDIILGINDKRRNSIRKYSQYTDTFIYLDNDVTFPDTALYYLLNSAKELIQNGLKYFIITPEITKYWDVSWDIITNDHYIHHPYNFRDSFNTSTLYNTSKLGEIELIENIYNVKFGGGWMNLFSSKLLEFTDIPDSLGSYGEDDTYVMIAADIMKQMGLKVKQYLVKNLVVTEEGKFRTKIYDNYLPKIKDNQEVRQQANINLPIELENFKNKCYDYILYTK
jgi:hypothetical protein